MDWEVDVNLTRWQVGLDVGAEFQSTHRNGVPSEWNGKLADTREGKLVRRTEEWTITLEYIAERSYEDAYDDYQFHTRTSMKALSNKNKARELEIFREVSKDKAPRGPIDTLINILGGDLNANWMLPIKDYTRLVTLFRLATRYRPDLPPK